MTRATAICMMISAIVLTGCGFHHPMPLKAAFDRVAFGQPLPAEFDRPIDAEHPDSAHLRGAYVEHEWANDTGAEEWALFLLDDNQRVIAKRYHARGQEIDWAILQYKSIDAGEWAVAGTCIDPADEIGSLRGICANLQLDKSGLPAIEGGAVQFEPSLPVRLLTTDELLNELAGSGQSLQSLPSWGFARTIRLDSQWPLHDSTRWKAKREHDGTVTLDVENRTDVSLASATAAGYAYIITHGGELPC